MSDLMGISQVSMANAMRQLDIISQNLANVNTNGYLREIPVNRSFDKHIEESLLQQISQQALIPSTSNIVDYSHGALRRTENPLDIVIEGEGFFEFQNGNELRYGRNGSFSVDNSGQLINSAGLIVNGMNGPITLTAGADISVHEDGEIYQNDNLMGQLKLVKFDDPALLQKDGAGMLKLIQTAPVYSDGESRLRQGYLEASNVEPVNEMVMMMTLIRNFEMNGKVVTNYDEMIGNAISTIPDFR